MPQIGATLFALEGVRLKKKKDSSGNYTFFPYWGANPQGHSSGGTGQMVHPTTCLIIAEYHMAAKKFAGDDNAYLD